MHLLKDVLLLPLLAALICFASPTLAQDTCSSDDITALTACTEVTRGQMCTISGTIQPIPLDSVATPAVMHVKGTQPAALPSHNLVVITLGDVSVTNAVTDDERFTPPEPIAVQPTVTARLRAEPTTDSLIVGGAESGTVLQADALNSGGGDWVRVAWDNSFAWVSRSLLTGDVSGLPTFDGGYGDYQAMEITFGDACGRVVLQPPRVTEMPVQINGEAIVINNTVVLDLSPDGWLRISALDGGVRLADGVRVPRGFSAMVQPSTGESRPPRPMSQPQLESYMPFTELPLGVVNEGVTLPQGAFIRPGIGE